MFDACSTFSWWTTDFKYVKGKKIKKWSKWTFQLEFQGFGNPSGEHWLGNEFVSQVTGQKRYVLKIHLRDWEGNEAYSLYDHFYLSNEELNYRWGNYMSLKRVKRLAGSQNPTVLTRIWMTQIRSDQISRSAVSDSLRPHESQHARPPCPSPSSLKGEKQLGSQSSLLPLGKCL